MIAFNSITIQGYVDGFRIVFTVRHRCIQRDENNQSQLVNVEQIQQLSLPESNLDRRVQNLIQLICNVQAMEEALLEMKFDARKNPLGNELESHVHAHASPFRQTQRHADQSRLFGSAGNRDVY